MSDTIGIHWIATTHGSWLHGDPRGSWRNGRLIGPDPFLESNVRARMTSNAVRLSAKEQELVAVEFGEIVREQRHRVFAAAIHAVHLHVVFAPMDQKITNAIARLKRRSASAVLKGRRAYGSQSLPQSVWTHGQCPIFIFDETYLVNAIEYVRDHNRRIGLPADPFDWIDPLYPPGKIAGERFFGYDRSEQPRI